MLTSVDDHLRPALHAWVASGDYTAEGTSDIPATGEFIDSYCGHWDTFEDYVRDLADDIGMLRDVPDEVQRYFDWARYACDLQHDYSVVDTTGGVFVFRGY